MRKPLKDARRDIARERIRVLFEQARERPEYAKRYVVLARKIQKRFRIRLARSESRAFCRRCCAFFAAGNFSVRTHKGHVVYTCKGCGNIMRYPYIREKRVRK